MLISIAGTGTAGNAIMTNNHNTNISTTGFVDANGNIAGTAIQLNSPVGISLDSHSSYLYVADSFNHKIRKISIATGLMTTIAGNGMQGSSGDGDIATQAQLNTPTGVGIDNESFVFVADYANHKIRYIGRGLMNTFAGTGVQGSGGDGGMADMAEFNYPYSVCVDITNGNVFVADSGNHLVRMIISSTGLITSLNGVLTGKSITQTLVIHHSSPTAPSMFRSRNTGLDILANVNALSCSTMSVFCVPSGITIDTSGKNIYVSNQMNNNVVQISMGSSNSQQYTIIAGTGVQGSTPDGILADTAKLNGPTGVVVSNKGIVYLADTGNCAVRVIAVPQPSSAPTVSPSFIPSRQPSKIQPTSQPTMQPSLAPSSLEKSLLQNGTSVGIVAPTVSNIGSPTTASNTIALIIGVAVGGWFFLILYVSLVVYFCYKKHKTVQPHYDVEWVGIVDNTDTIPPPSDLCDIHRRAGNEIILNFDTQRFIPLVSLDAFRGIRTIETKEPEHEQEYEQDLEYELELEQEGMTTMSTANIIRVPSPTTTPHPAYSI